MIDQWVPEHIREHFSKMDPQVRDAYFALLNHIQKLGYSIRCHSGNSLLFTYDQFSICYMKFEVYSNDAFKSFLRFDIWPTEPTEFECAFAKKNPLFLKLWKSWERWFDSSFEGGNPPKNFWIYSNPSSRAPFGQNLERFVRIFEQVVDVFFKPEIVVDFRIESLTFENYRCFKDETFTFNEKSTVLIGKNASGKTSLLEGITVAIGGFLRGIDEKVDKNGIDEKDVRFTMREVQGVLDVNHHPPTTIQVKSTLLNHSIDWSRTRRVYKSDKTSRTTYKESHEVTNIVKQLVMDIRSEDMTRQITLPVFSYHGTGRVASFTKDMNGVEEAEKISRFFAYKDCLKPNSNYKTFIGWYRKMRFRAVERNIQIPSLNAVTATLVQGLRLLTEQEEQPIDTVLFDEGELHVKLTDGSIYPISKLSDGYQDFIGIISDIAFRMAVLNPHLGADTTSKTPGIVLIDEVDQHLHPKWQQNILTVLKTLFPRVQIISTTHSPIIVSGTEQNEALELYQEEGRICTKPIGNPADWYISDILAQAFHVYAKPSLPVKKMNEEAPLEERLHEFSHLVKAYLSTPTDEQRQEIEEQYQALLPSLPADSPRRRAVDSLKGLVK